MRHRKNIRNPQTRGSISISAGAAEPKQHKGGALIRLSKRKTDVGFPRGGGNYFGLAQHLHNPPAALSARGEVVNERFNLSSRPLMACKRTTEKEAVAKMQWINRRVARNSAIALKASDSPATELPSAWE
ncbi:hypothetical protein EVAR_10574_1 [Eumeta japonica]|uniref:Uncharacterized protein n=1 Tax=Eumeta variegata TaxID=151549 RepID=A0A4C1U1S4_EUMVA|nr:hypothetical protein EVAR_10574_1 [Eumeta japonica]